jgi:uncharacterized RDD family membrane protein YckC
LEASVDNRAGVPGLGRRFASLLYEAVLMFGIAFAAASLFQFAAGEPQLQGWHRPLLWVYLAGVFAAYFIWCWMRGGQTLPMKSWRIRLVAAAAPTLSPTAALVRFGVAALPVVGFFLIGDAMPLAALVLLVAAAFNFLWAFVDRDRQFLHDRIAGTRLILLEPAPRRTDGP